VECLGSPGVVLRESLFCCWTAYLTAVCAAVFAPVARRFLLALGLRLPSFVRKGYIAIHAFGGHLISGWKLDKACNHLAKQKEKRLRNKRKRCVGMLENVARLAY
jgi:hypothetical protein